MALERIKTHPLALGGGWCHSGGATLITDYGIVRKSCAAENIIAAFRPLHNVWRKRCVIDS
jgi:hypothetical protein